MSTYGDGILHGADFNSTGTEADIHTLVMRPYRLDELAIYGIAFDDHDTATATRSIHERLGSLAEDVLHQSTERADTQKFNTINEWCDHAWRTAASIFETQNEYAACGLRASAKPDKIHALSTAALEQHEVTRGPREAVLLSVETIGRNKQVKYHLVGRIGVESNVNLEREIEQALSINRDADTVARKLWKTKGQPHAMDWYGRQAANTFREVCRQWASKPATAGAATTTPESVFTILRAKTIRPVVVSQDLVKIALNDSMLRSQLHIGETLDHTQSSRAET